VAGDTRIVAFADSQAGGEDSDEERRKRKKKRRAVKSKKYVLRIPVGIQNGNTHIAQSKV